LEHHPEQRFESVHHVIAVRQQEPDRITEFAVILAEGNGSSRYFPI